MRLQLVLFCLSWCSDQLPEPSISGAWADSLQQVQAAVKARQSLSFDVVPPTLPAGAVEYTPTKVTQEIAVTNGFDRISQVPISRLESKWHQSGGMEGLTGWTSKKYRFVPEGEYEMAWIGTIQVLNSFGSYQPNRGLMRSYPIGTEFHDVLRTEKGIFEHRVRKKLPDGWKSAVIFFDKKARPAGYTGLKVTCASCHNSDDGPGSGKYGVGLVQGGDTVFSDPLDWSLVRGSR